MGTNNGVQVKCSRIEDTVFIEFHIDGLLAKVHEDHDAIDADHISARAEYLQDALDKLTRDQVLELLWPRRVR
tara:strand:- start:365 stop:583 length:219 start_codon:yes stop_codon:yes gene_type:complete